MHPYCLTPAYASRADIARFERRSHAERLAARHAVRARDIAGHWVGSWSARQWLELLERHCYRCAYCGREFEPHELVPEHRVPLARGGRNCIANLYPACSHCNSQKGARTDAEYLEWLAERERERAA